MKNKYEKGNLSFTSCSYNKSYLFHQKKKFLSELKCVHNIRLNFSMRPITYDDMPKNNALDWHTELKILILLIFIYFVLIHMCIQMSFVIFNFIVMK